MDDEGSIDFKPRETVLEHLERIGSHLAIPYLEYVIELCNERATDFHSKLVRLYLDRLQLELEKDTDRHGAVSIGSCFI